MSSPLPLLPVEGSDRTPEHLLVSTSSPLVTAASPSHSTNSMHTQQDEGKILLRYFVVFI